MTGTQARLLQGSEHPCSYLPGRVSRSLFVNPQLELDALRYGRLLELGFRRSGSFVYRPACAKCQECRPVRVPVAEFQPDRSQRRCLRRNGDLESSLDHELNEEHFELYRRYIRARHAGGGMDPDDRETFRTFLANQWGDADILSLRDPAGTLLAGAVTDRVPQGLSAVYTYFDPDLRARGLGTYSVLMQIARAQALHLPHLYLGFWVAGSAKMNYKQHFRPLEVLTPQGWRKQP